MIGFSLHDAFSLLFLKTIKFGAYVYVMYQVFRQ